MAFRFILSGVGHEINHNENFEAGLGFLGLAVHKVTQRNMAGHLVKDIECEAQSDILIDDMFRRTLWAYADQHQIDVAVQSLEQFATPTRLAVFDMDSTLLKAEVIDELAVEHGVADEVKVITESAMRGEIDFKQSFTQRMAMLKGLNEQAVNTVLARLQLMDGATEAFQFFKEQSIYTAILSGGFDVFAQQVQSQLSIHEILCNQLECVNGALTGQVIEPVIDAKAKQAQLVSMAQRLNIPLKETLAVGDGANDLLMLATAGRGIAFHAKPKVRASVNLSIQLHGLDILPCFLSAEL